MEAVIWRTMAWISAVTSRSGRSSPSLHAPPHPPWIVVPPTSAHTSLRAAVSTAQLADGRLRQAQQTELQIRAPQHGWGVQTSMLKGINFIAWKFVYNCVTLPN